MELYYKDLISKESSLEKLVDDLMRVVQGTDELAQAASAGQDRPHLDSQVEQLKEGYQRFRERAIAVAVAADKLMRRYPYSTLGVAFAIGLLAGRCFHRKR
jgi:ElaB/YqjD/DUF883 family membrane-anchored ribosome-binding protein